MSDMQIWQVSPLLANADKVPEYEVAKAETHSG